MLLLGCSGPAKPVAENHACFRALDCQDGLVCVLGRCTTDITPIVPEGAGVAPEPDPEPEGEPVMPGADAGP